MNLHNNDQKKTVKRKTVLSVIMAASICSLLLAVVVAVDYAPAGEADGNIVAEMP